MQKRLLVVLVLLGATGFLALLITLLLMEPPRTPLEEIPAPPASVPAPVDDGVRAIKQSGMLMGRVVDGLTGKGIASAKVAALKPHLEPAGEGEPAPRWGDLIEMARVFTAPDGRFRITDLPPDYWNLWVEKRGYAWSTVPRAKFDERHEIKLYPGASVKGKVVYADDTPAAGVRIEYHVQGTHSEVFSHYRLESYYTQTREDGTFEYTDLPPTKFTIEVYPRDSLPAPWRYEPALKPGDERDLGVHTLNDGFGMTVHVKWRGTNEGVPDVEVVVRPLGDPMPRTKTGQRRRTDADGVARFKGLGGQVIDRPKFIVVANVDGVGPVQADTGGMHDPNSTVTIYLRKDGVIKGKVARPNGNPLERFFVQLEPVGHFTRQLQVFGENGAFTLYQVPEGKYLLHARYGNLIDATVKVEAIGGQEVDVGTITLAEGAMIDGVVRRANGKELEGVVRVHLGRKTRNRAGQEVWEIVGRAYCLKDGGYTIKGIPPGAFYLWPESYRTPSGTTDPLPVTVPEGNPVLQRDLVLYGEAFLNLKFYDFVKGKETHVQQPTAYLIETATGKEIRWWGVGTALRPGRYTLLVELKDAQGVLKRYKVKEVTAQERESPRLGTDYTDPIEIRLYEIRDGS